MCDVDVVHNKIVSFVKADPSVGCYEEGLFLCPRKHEVYGAMLADMELTAVHET